MTTELTLLAWLLVLALIQVLIPAELRNRETGRDYNASARDRPGPPIGVVTALLGAPVFAALLTRRGL